LFAAYSPSLVLTWTDRRPRPAWCLLCLLILLAIAEVASRGYALAALGSLPGWIGLAWAGMPAARYDWRFEVQGSQYWLTTSTQARSEPISIEPGSVLLANVVVLRWKPLGHTRRRGLWLWAMDFEDSDYRALRRWWVVHASRVGGKGTR
jgi:hypothetical protein